MTSQHSAAQRSTEKAWKIPSRSMQHNEATTEKAEKIRFRSIQHSLAPRHAEKVDKIRNVLSRPMKHNAAPIILRRQNSKVGRCSTRYACISSRKIREISLPVASHSPSRLLRHFFGLHRIVTCVVQGKKTHTHTQKQPKNSLGKTEAFSVWAAGTYHRGLRVTTTPSPSHADSLVLTV